MNPVELSDVDAFLKSMKGAYFISGIHTDAGKSYCTGWLAAALMSVGKNVVTQKFVQTGNKDFPKISSFTAALWAWTLWMSTSTIPPLR